MRMKNNVRDGPWFDTQDERILPSRLQLFLSGEAMETLTDSEREAIHEYARECYRSLRKLIRATPLHLMLDCTIRSLGFWDDGGGIRLERARRMITLYHAILFGLRETSYEKTLRRHHYLVSQSKWRDRLLYEE